MKGQTNSWLKDIVSGEKISITLTTNQSSHTDLMGAVVTVSYAGNLTEYTWGGSAIQTIIPPMTDYTVSYSNVNDYSTPEPFSGKAIDGRVSEVIGTYNTEVVTVSVSAEEGEVSGYEVSIITNVVGKTNKYIPIEYIEATGSQYTNTGFMPTVNTKLISELEVPAGIGNKNIFCASTNFVLNSKSDNQLEYKLYNVIGYTHVTTPSPITSRFKVEYSPQTLKFNDEVIASPNASSLSNSNTMWLFSREGGSSTYYGYGKIYYLKLYESGELVRDYIPVKSLDGKIGLYDKINGTFISSNSGTEFVGGNVLGTTMTQTTPSASYKIPYGISYMAKASSVSGYTTPSEQSFTASQPSRNVDVIYGVAHKGVFIQDIYGRLYTEDEWDGTQTANGIAVLTDECQFVMAFFQENINKTWGETGVDISNLENYADVYKAAEDFDGVGNTSKIMAAYSNYNTAAGYCALYTSTNGKTCYLGAAGEWQAIYNNMTTITRMIGLIGGVSLKSKVWWTSTECDGNWAWVLELTSNESVKLDYTAKTNGRQVYPLTPYIANPKIISFTITGTNGTFQFQAIEGTNSHFWNQSAFCPTDDIYGYIGAFSTAWESGFIIEDGGAYRFSEPY